MVILRDFDSYRVKYFYIFIVHTWKISKGDTENSPLNHIVMDLDKNRDIQDEIEETMDSLDASGGYAINSLLSSLAQEGKDAEDNEKYGKWFLLAAARFFATRRRD